MAIQMVPLLLLVSPVYSHEEKQLGARFHCINETISNSSINGYTSHFHCVRCFFPQNCLENNTCLEGTEGLTCESCISTQEGQTGYYRVGNTCIECGDIPVAAIGFGLYLLLLLIASVTNGFTASLCTKLKIICHYLQLTYLTYHVKIRWPDSMQNIMRILNFSNFNSKILDLGCLFPDFVLPMRVYYLDWSTSFLALIITVVAVLFLDRSMRLVISREKEEASISRHWKKRSRLRRFSIFIVVTMYMPVAMSSMHTYLCTDNIPLDLQIEQVDRNIFLFEQDQLCSSYIFQVIHFVATLILVIFVLFLPIFIVFFTLRQRKWNLLKKTRKQYGSLYESYEPRCCYWEAVPMCRKLMSIAATDMYPLSGVIQSVAVFSLSGVYLLLLITLQPYRPIETSSSKVQMHLIFEVLANIVIATLQAHAILISHELYIEELDYVLLFLMGTVVFIGVTMILFTPMESKKEEEITVTDLDAEEMTEMPQAAGIMKKKNKVAPTNKTFEEETREHQENMAF